jgi:ubiquinone/menaquinone biosynthesis C-methylase UbiE
MFPREPQHEWMDAADVDPAELQNALRFIERVNRWLGYTRATVSHLNAFSRQWDPGQTVTILDIATGSADVPMAIWEWAGRQKVNVRIIGLDRHEKTLAVAHERTRGTGIEIVQGDALSLPYADESVDYCMSSMFLHHLSEGDALRALREMNRVARRGVIVADLLRDRRALFWISLFTMFSNPMVRHDARVSVRQAFTRIEMEHLKSLAGLNYVRYFRHFGHRFVLAGEK